MSVQKSSTVFAAFLSLLCLASCGKRGNLEYPSNQAPNRVYPAPHYPQITLQPARAQVVPSDIDGNPAMQEQILDSVESPDQALEQTVAPALTN